MSSRPLPPYYDSGEQYPHCDPWILHAPRICEYCDRHPEWQADRISYRINFTLEDDPSKMPCPSSEWRSDGGLSWGGNVPTSMKEQYPHWAYPQDVGLNENTLGLLAVDPEMFIYSGAGALSGWKKFVKRLLGH